MKVYCILINTGHSVTNLSNFKRIKFFIYVIKNYIKSYFSEILLADRFIPNRYLYYS